MFNSTPVSLPSACRHSWKCSACYSVECSSGCVAEIVEMVQSSQTPCLSLHPPPTRGTVCAHVQCGWDVLVICTNHYLTETRWELGREGGGAVWGKLGGARESCGGGGAVCGSCFPALWGK